MNKNKNLKDDCAGSAADEQVPATTTKDRREALLRNNEAYRLRHLAAASASRAGEPLQPGLEDGQTIYWKRKSGKVASFFRCLLR